MFDWYHERDAGLFSASINATSTHSFASLGSLISAEPSQCTAIFIGRGSVE